MCRGVYRGTRIGTIFEGYLNVTQPQPTLSQETKRNFVLLAAPMSPLLCKKALISIFLTHGALSGAASYWKRSTNTSFI